MASEYPFQAEALWNEEASWQKYRPNDYPTQPQTLWDEDASWQIYRPNDYPTQPQTLWDEDASWQIPRIQLPPQKLPILALPKAQSPRKFLTDEDRKRVCQYHEDNPSAKQTEIGKMFGVERSTISKVLKKKETYLQHRSGSLPLAKHAKRKPLNIERALKQRRGVDSLPSPASSKIMSEEEVKVNIHSATPLSGLSLGVSTAMLPPTRDEARDALKTLLLFSCQESLSILDKTDYACILKLLGRLQ